MTRTRNEWETANTKDVFWHRKLMTETLLERDQADLLVTSRVSDGNITGLYLETIDGAIELTALQVNGLLSTLAEVSPEQVQNVLDGNYDDYDDDAEQDRLLDELLANAERVAEDEYNDYRALSLDGAAEEPQEPWS